MKYVIGLLALCFCLGLSLDVGAVSQQTDQTEFVQAQAPIVFCESIEVDFAILTPTEAPAIVPYSQPGESHGNLRRLCGYSLGVITTCPSLQIEAPPFERYRPRTSMCSDSASAKGPDDNCLRDWKVGWQVA